MVLNRQVSKEGIKISKEQQKDCSMSLAIRGIQFKLCTCVLIAVSTLQNFDPFRVNFSEAGKYGSISFFYYFQISSYLRKSDQDLKNKTKPGRECVYEDMEKEDNSFTLVELHTDASVEIDVANLLKAKSRSIISPIYTSLQHMSNRLDILLHRYLFSHIH